MEWEEHRNSITIHINSEKELCNNCKEVYDKYSEEFNQEKDKIYRTIWEKYFPTIKIEQL